jgi:capsular exopolysaccharide synthesis family protein
VDLADILRAARRYWWLVAAAVVVSLGFAGLATALAEPQYATSTTFFVTTPSEGVSESYTGGLYSKQRVTSYEYLLRGTYLQRGDLVRAVAAADGVNLSPAQVQERISSRAVPETVLLQVTVTDSDPARSERIAKALSTEFVSLVERLETPPGKTTPSVKVQVIAGPTLNPVPVSPKPARNFALAALLGLLLGVAAVMVRRMLDLTVKTAEALQQVTGAPVLALVPFDPGVKKHTPLVAGTRVAEGAAKRNKLHSARAEAYRHLRTNLQFVDVDHPPKVIVIASAVLDEGKSTTAVNLAIAFAEAGHRVALVEADLRRPRMAHYLGLEGAVGLSNVLAGQVDVGDVLQRWGRHELHLLASGPTPPKPSELLGSRNMTALLGRLREAFDVVIVDTPPVLPFTDAAVVAAAADGTVLIVRSGKTHQARIRTAIANLHAVDSRLLGCVLNMQAAKAEEGYYYYGYRYRDGRRHSRLVPVALPSGAASGGNGAASLPESVPGTGG